MSGRIGAIATSSHSPTGRSPWHREPGFMLCGRSMGWETAQADRGFTTRSFTGVKGGTEHFIAVTVRSNLDLENQIGFVEDCYAAARCALGLAPETAVFRRV